METVGNTKTLCRLSKLGQIAGPAWSHQDEMTFLKLMQSREEGLHPSAWLYGSYIYRQRISRMDSAVAAHIALTRDERNVRGVVNDKRFSSKPIAALQRNGNALRDGNHQVGLPDPPHLMNAP
jgi:hypothetical protein